MKFSHSIQFNAVPDWASHYISYSNLKKLIYQLEKQINQGSGQQVDDPENAPLLSSVDEPDKIFSQKLDEELNKICKFFKRKEAEVYDEVDALLGDVVGYEAEQASHPSEVRVRRQNLGVWSESITLKKRIVNLYVDISDLKSFVSLNQTGFGKVLKKYDKTLNRHLKPVYMREKVAPAYPFTAEIMERAKGYLARIEDAYARIATQGDVELARRELRLHLREHVVWERNTVWREMISVERRGQAANLGLKNTIVAGDEKKATPSFLRSGSFWVLMSCLAVFAVLLGVRFMDQAEQQNCLAMVVFVSLLWATEAIPLFVTSMLVPLLVVLLRVVRVDDERLDSKATASFIFGAMWTPVMMLLLGGFTIAAALSKYNIAKMLATFVLSKAGTRPAAVLLTSMGVALFASMWISNVAAPVLCFSLIQPLLRNLPPESDMAKALLMGIALASNIGGAASPIASPQNLIALENMDPQPGWGIWFFIALPVCLLSILIVWLLLLVTFRPSRGGTSLVAIRPMRDPFTPLQWFISAVTILTIILWCLTHRLEGIFGDMGVIAIVPIGIFFGSGILTKEDFNNFLWTIIMLAGGGLALGKAVASSGLLTALASTLIKHTSNLPLYATVSLFAAITLITATFISHTVSALILLPLVREIGAGMNTPHPNLLVMTCAIISSAAMGLPTSGFPNMCAVMMEDGQGRRYLSVRHFLTRGVPASLGVYAVTLSVGYGVMLVVGF
ncbi:SPX-domain-containing protein [Piedraia hortae CBS 480.64]|uniref:SPX-domain-containing protein n=1 Tax=Piedraia hortae CBS 480.64 TaxID=1314780 RepID=A0A6A7BTR0_9PEZI|nr:SPX-domain-containing protein [Piedraia hortae CBS 480.64]